MRARMGLWSARIDVELREIVLRNKPSEMLKASPKGTVPVLILEDGRVIDESIDIMLWALEQSDPDGWLEIEREAQLALVEDCQVRFKPHLDRYKYTSRYDGAEKEEEAAKCIDWLSELTARLARQDWLLGERLQLADIAVFPFVRQFAHTDMEVFASRTSKPLQDWLERCKALPELRSVFKKYKPWADGDEAIYLGPGST